MNNHMDKRPNPICSSYAPLLPQYGLGLLPQDDEQRVRTHLKTCDSCQAQIALLQQLDSALVRQQQALAQGAPPLPAFLQHVYTTATPKRSSMFHRRHQTTARQIPSLSGFHRLLIGLPSVAIVVLVIVATFFIFHIRQLSGIGGPRIVGPFATADLSGIAMVSPSEGWAVGAQGNDPMAPRFASAPLLEHYHNGHWQAVKAPALGFAYSLDSIAMSSSDDGWATGSDNHEKAVLLHYDGHGWTSVTSQISDGVLIRVSKAFAKDDAWGIANTLNGIGNAYPIHFDGHDWKPVPLILDGMSVHLDASIMLAGNLDMLTPTEGWAVLLQFKASSDTSTIIHYVQGQWSTSGIFAGSISSISVASDGTGWGVIAQSPTGPSLLSYDQGRWSSSNTSFLPPNRGPQIIATNGATNTWLVADGTLPPPASSTSVYHYDGTHWVVSSIESSLPMNTLIYVLNSVVLLADGEVWIVGQTFAPQSVNTNGGQTFIPHTAAEEQQGIILHYQSGAWSAVLISYDKSLES